MYPDQMRYQPASRWGQSIEDIYRKTNKNLNTGVYIIPQAEFYRIDRSNISSAKRLDDASYQYQQPSVTSQHSRTGVNFYPNSNQNVFKPSSSNGFSNNNSVQVPLNNPKTFYVRSNDGGTIEHVPEEFDFGTVGEDIEAHYIQANQLQSRGKSQNSKYPPAQKLMRTIDDNVNHHRDLVKNQRTVFDDELEERQRIFEDEIIKRVKIIQNFVKNLDSKFSKFRKNALTKKFDEQPEKLREAGIKSPTSALGGVSQSDIKEMVKWEIEVVEKKSEDRFIKIETSQKQLKKKVEDQIHHAQSETQNEFENLKAQFEEFGNSIYDRITHDLLAQINKDLKSQSDDLTHNMREETNKLLMSGLSQHDKKIMNIESQLEDVRIAQEQTLEEINKYQDSMDKIIEQNYNSLDSKFFDLSQEFEKLKVQIKKDKPKDIDVTQFVQESEFQEQIDYMRSQIMNLQTGQKNTKPGQNIDSEEMFRIEKKLKQKIEDIDIKFSNQDHLKKGDLENVEENLRTKMKEFQFQLDNVQNLSLDAKNSYKKELVNLETVIDKKLEDLERKIKAQSQQMDSLKLQGHGKGQDSYDVANSQIYDIKPMQTNQVSNKSFIESQSQHKQPEVMTVKSQSRPQPVGNSNKQNRYYADDSDKEDTEKVETIKQQNQVQKLNADKAEVYLLNEGKKEDSKTQNTNINSQKPVDRNNIWGQIEEVEEFKSLDEVEDIQVLKFQKKLQQPAQVNSKPEADQSAKPLTIPQTQSQQPSMIVSQQQKQENKRSAFTYGDFSDEDEDEEDDDNQESFQVDQIEDLLDVDGQPQSPQKFQQLKADKQDINTFTKAVQDNEWDEDQQVSDNVETYIDIYIEYQIEKLIKEFGKDHPNLKKLIDEISFSYV